MKPQIPFNILFAIVTGVITVDIYIPCLPNMMADFQTTEKLMQFSISLAMIVGSVFTIFIGPLSDAYGRKKFLILGQLTYALSSFFAARATSIDEFLLWRFVHGFACVPALVLSFAIIADVYKDFEAHKYYALSTTAITCSLIFAPLLGGFFDTWLSWRAGFYFIATLASLSCISIFFTLPETLPQKSKFELWKSLKNYGVVLSSGRFLGLAIMPALLLATMLAFFSVASFYFVHELKISSGTYAIYQSIILFFNTFLNSFTAKAIQKMGKFKTALGGILLIASGVVSFALAPLFFPKSDYLITMAIALYSGGLGFSWAVFLGDNMAIFPHMSGVSSALMSILRGAIISLMIAFAALIYNKTLLPMMGLFVSVLIISGTLFWALYVKKKDATA